VEENSHHLWNPRFISQVIDCMADGVFTLDANGMIVSWNPSMERISGYSAREALGRSCDLLHCSRCFDSECPEDMKRCSVMQFGKTEAKECLLRHKDGRPISVIKNASVVRDDDGEVIGVVETVTDMTELVKARKNAEEAVRRLGEVHQFGNIIGKSDAMQQVFTAIKAAAASDATILIQGESGTGKELVAGAIHYNGLRAEKPLVTVNCSALSESLLESELFGHVRGAFTGANRDRLGRFEEADGGTIFLDEIGDLSPFIQVKLLRVLQERQVERVGDSAKRRVDIRIITATHMDLYALVREGRFREDLYYRLKVFPIRMPPLRNRKEDIPLLALHFIESLNVKTGKSLHGLTPQAMRMIMDYNWPGNVRELENAIEHAFVLCGRGQIDTIDLPLEIRNVERTMASEVIQKQLPASIRVMKQGELIGILEACGWNKAEAARRVGISRTAIWKHMKRLGIPLKLSDITSEDQNKSIHGQDVRGRV
jgi:two-component system, NtrC family, response regulator HydG